MPFTLTWTSPDGSDQLVVATATEAMRAYEARVNNVIRLTVTDNHGRKLTYDDLYELDCIANEAGDA
jgi:hypothetical protein